MAAATAARESDCLPLSYSIVAESFRHSRSCASLGGAAGGHSSSRAPASPEAFLVAFSAQEVLYLSETEGESSCLFPLLACFFSVIVRVLKERNIFVLDLFFFFLRSREKSPGPVVSLFFQWFVIIIISLRE